MWGAGLAFASVCAESVEATRAVALALVAVGTVWLVTRVADAHCCAEARLAGLADSRVGGTVYAIWVLAGLSQEQQAKYKEKVLHISILFIYSPTL